jgi:hypothetical protein
MPARLSFVATLRECEQLRTQGSDEILVEAPR